MQRFIDWANEGRRSVKIEIDSRNEGEITVWCYDFDLMAGDFIGINDNLPTEKELKEQEINYLLGKVKELEKQ